MREPYEEDREYNAVAEWTTEEADEEPNSGMSWEALERLAAMRRADDSAVSHASPEEIELARVCAVSRERRAWQLMQEAEKHLVRCVEHWNNAQTELFSYGPKN